MKKPTNERPSLACPECGVPLIPAHGRGRVDRDGDDIPHGGACRCRWCGWMWWDDRGPTRCACGALVRVKVDDGHAYASTVEKPPRSRWMALDDVGEPMDDADLDARAALDRDAGAR